MTSGKPSPVLGGPVVRSADRPDMSWRSLYSVCPGIASWSMLCGAPRLTEEVLPQLLGVRTPYALSHGVPGGAITCRG